MNNTSAKTRRQIRIRAKVQGTSDKPRLSIFRSNKFIYAQIIDDVAGKTILGVSEQAVVDSKSKLSKIENAKKLGESIAKQAKEKKIVKVVFDKGSYAYHGRVKAVAEGAREGGLQF
jgi:large subunit ribosomal protein L18